MKRITGLVVSGLVACSVASVAQSATKAAPAKNEAQNTKMVSVKGEELVFGFADAQQLNMTQAAQERLVELQMINDEETAKVQRKQEELNKGQQEYNAKKSTLSKAAREAEESRLVALKNELQSLVETSKLKVSRAIQEKTEEMVAAVEQAAAEVAKRQNIDVIMDTASGRTLYVSEKAMVTQDLIKEMNKQSEVKVAKGKDSKNAPAAAKGQIKA